MPVDKNMMKSAVIWAKTKKRGWLPPQDIDTKDRDLL